MMIVFQIFLISCSLFFAQAAEPLVKPKKQDVYEFNMELRWRLTMAHYTCDYSVQHVNYYPDTGLWFLRDSDQLQPCHKEYLITNHSLLADVVQYHGKHDRIMTMNDKSPGEPFVVYLGSEVIIRVDNRLAQEGVTLHIHGMHQNNRWYMDGVAMVQQCPIAARSIYTYRFIADTPGTLWFHGHLGPDRGEGFVGAFIVLTDDDDIELENGSKLTPDVDYVLVLQDWPVLSMGEVWYNHIGDSNKYLYGSDSDQCWAPTRTYDGSNMGGSVPLSGILFNDKGWYDFDAVTNRPYTLPLERFKIKSGQNALLRVINGGNAQELMVSIEQHKLLVVAADGMPVHATEVDMVVIFPGERYDILIKGTNEPKYTDYYIIAETLEYYNWTWQYTAPRYGIAVLEYDSKTASTKERAPDLKHSDCTNANKCLVLNCPFAIFPSQYNYKCMPAAELGTIEPAPSELLATEFNGNYEEHFLNMHFDSHVNGWRFQFPRAPPYFHNDDELSVVTPCVNEKCTTAVGPDKRDFDCYCFHHLNITYGNVVQLVVYNMGNGSQPGKGYSHPLHIHGMHFYVVKIGFPNYNQSTGLEGANNPDIPCDTFKEQCNFLEWTHPSWMNGNVPDMSKNPPLRDTTVVPAGGYIVVRFKADNPGWFFAHCHVILHHAGGMAFALRIGKHEQMAVPPDNMPRDCGVFEPPPISDSGQKQPLGKFSFEQAQPHLSTHALDTSNGQPAAGLKVALYTIGTEKHELVANGQTDENGHISCLNAGFELVGGRYKMVFEIEEYFDNLDQDTFYPYAEIYFAADEGESYHLPLILNRFGYTTYQGQEDDPHACDNQNEESGNDKKIGKRSIDVQIDKNRTIKKKDTVKYKVSTHWPYRSHVSTHVLDISNGVPGKGVRVNLYFLKDDKFVQINQEKTDSTGHIEDLHPGHTLEIGTYKIDIATTDYFDTLKQQCFYTKTEVIFKVDDLSESYHVPVLLSNYAFTSYIGQASSGPRYREESSGISTIGIVGIIIAVAIVCLIIVLALMKFASTKDTN